MAKMCKWFGKREICPRDRRDWCYYARKGLVKDDCSLVTPKAKYKTVKAWAWIRDGKVWDACVNKWSTTKRLIPCEIRINTKYLKGVK